MELYYHELKKILPHAYPFLMIDRVVEIKKGKSLVALKNITANEWWCEGWGAGWGKVLGCAHFHRTEKEELKRLLSNGRGCLRI